MNIYEEITQHKVEFRYDKTLAGGHLLKAILDFISLHILGKIYYIGADL